MTMPAEPEAGHAALVADLTRRGFLERAGAAGIAALVASAVPVGAELLAAQPAGAAAPSLPDATLQAFADTIIPGRKATRTDLGHEIHPQAIAGVDPLPGAVEADALTLYHDPLTGFDALEPAFLAELSARSLVEGGVFLTLPFDRRVRVVTAGLSFENPARVVWEAAAAVPFTAFCAAAEVPNATAAKASGYRVMGLPGIAPNGYRSFSYGKRLSRERTKKGYLRGAASDGRARRRPDRGFGLRRLDHGLPPGRALPRGGRRPEVDRGARARRRHKHTDFRQSMDIDHLSDVYELIQGQGAQIVAANAVGGGSNLYLAASLRAPTETFERRDRRPGDGPERRMWPAAISRKSLDPYYLRAELGLRVNQPGWDRISKSGGLWAATLKAAGHTCDRVPVAINPNRCVDAKWCHTGCIFGAKNSLITNYLPSAERLGVQIRPDMRVESVKQSSARPYRFVVTVSKMDNEGPSPSRMASGTSEIECKVLILSTGAMGNAPILMRSSGALPALSPAVGKHLGVNGDHIAAVEYDPAKVRSILGLPGYADFHKGKPITTMSYDWWVGRGDHRYDGTRFNLQEIFLSSLTNFLYDDGRAPAGDPSWWGMQKKQAIAHWSNRIEILAMVEDTSDGTFLGPPPGGGGRTAQRRAGRGRDVHLRVLRAVGPGPRGRQRGHQARRRAPRPRAVHGAHRDPGARTPRIRWAAAGWRSPPTSAWSTTAARPSATRASSASTPRSSPPRSASTRP